MIGEATTFATEVSRDAAMKASAAAAAAGKCAAGGWMEWLNWAAGWGVGIGLAVLIIGIVMALVGQLRLPWIVFGAALMGVGIYGLSVC